jgi:hypothetical protein
MMLSVTHGEILIGESKSCLIIGKSHRSDQWLAAIILIAVSYRHQIIPLGLMLALWAIQCVIDERLKIFTRAQITPLTAEKCPLGTLNATNTEEKGHWSTGRCA